VLVILKHLLKNQQLHNEAFKKGIHPKLKVVDLVQEVSNRHVQLEAQTAVAALPGGNNMNSKLFSDLLSKTELKSIINFQAPVYLVVCLIILILAKWAYNLVHPFNLNEQLHQKDNKAVALSFLGFMLGTGYILLKMLSHETIEASQKLNSFGSDLISLISWSLIGIVLMLIARVINDKVLLRHFSNTKELIEDRNIGTGAVEFGAYLGTGILIAAALTGEGQGSFLQSLALVLIYFVFGQVSFLAFAWIYQKLANYDLHDEIEKDNAAAGLGFGLSLVAMGLMMGHFISENDSLIGASIWFILSTFSLIACRIFVDKLILPGADLDIEISRDRNWGAAILEGGLALLIALLVNAAY
jgi:uncharacterized membrane protein YjfL (UPF0719 family)